jgi:hypothetical protein
MLQIFLGERFIHRDEGDKRDGKVFLPEDIFVV